MIHHNDKDYYVKQAEVEGEPLFVQKIGEGTGMGLDIVAKIIRNHKGEVKLTSLPGLTKFIFYFPIIEN